MGFPSGSVVKQQPILVFLPGESHGQRSLRVIVHSVAKSWTQLKWLCTHTCMFEGYCPVVFVKDSCLSGYMRVLPIIKVCGPDSHCTSVSSLEQLLKADTVFILQKRKLKTPWLNPESPREFEMTLGLKPVYFGFHFCISPFQVWCPLRKTSPSTC